MLNKKKEKEEQKKKEESVIKVPKKDKNGNYFCGNKGCSKKVYNPETEVDEECKHHSGQPVFHDLRKYWNCCNAESWDFDDFLKLPTCTEGKHTPLY